MAFSELLRLVFLAAATTLASCVYIFSSWLKSVFNRVRPWRRTRRLLEHEMRHATSYSAWESAARAADALSGREAWKAAPDSPMYDSHGIATRLRQLRTARHSGDPAEMIRLVRENLDRGVAGLGNPLLYTHCHVGTKALIEEYIDEMCCQLRTLASTPGGYEVLAPIERALADGRQAYGRSALMLSGGLSFGMCHWGVAKTLFEQRLMPSYICGASIGALVASLLGAHTDTELGAMFADEASGSAINFEAFERLAPGSATRKLKRLLKHGVLNDVGKLEELCRSNLGNLTFAESYKRTGRTISISVPHPADPLLPTLLNHVTTPDVVLWSAACASCAQPGLFPPIPLMMKDMEGRVVPLRPASASATATGAVEEGSSSVGSDGSGGYGFVGGGGGLAQHQRRWKQQRRPDLPMRRLSALFNVNHFIVSQVNPHIVPLLRATRSTSRFTLLHRAAMMAGREALHWLKQLVALASWPGMRWLRWLQEDLEQTYQGDITLVPHLSLAAIRNADANPSKAAMAHYTRAGATSTYSYVPHIRARCAIEIALRDSTRTIRQRLRVLGRDVPVSTPARGGAGVGADVTTPASPALLRPRARSRGAPTSPEHIPPRDRAPPKLTFSTPSPHSTPLRSNAVKVMTPEARHARSRACSGWTTPVVDTTSNSPSRHTGSTHSPSDKAANNEPTSVVDIISKGVGSRGPLLVSSAAPTAVQSPSVMLRKSVAKVPSGAKCCNDREFVGVD